MGLRSLLPAVLLAITSAALVRADPAPESQRTHPHVSPAQGSPAAKFVARFTLRQPPGHTGVLQTVYVVSVTRLAKSGARCTPGAQRTVMRGNVGDTVRVRLKPPAKGWCTGRHRVTVLLEQGPYCPPGNHDPCPKFATTELDTGHATFRVT